jgi:ribosomal protein S12 methylthiotransferase accessory factor YcaO
VGNPHNRSLKTDRWRGVAGQVLVEYLMVLGLLAAIIISVTRVIVPVLSLMVVSLSRFIAVHLTSV